MPVDIPCGNKAESLIIILSIMYNNHWTLNFG